MFLIPSPIRYSVETREKLQKLEFNTVCGVRGEAKKVKLCLCDCLSGVSAKEQKSKFVPRFYSLKLYGVEGGGGGDRVITPTLNMCTIANYP